MILSHIVRALRAWWRYRSCVQELSRFNDLELADIGLSRSDIFRVARGAGRATAMSPDARATPRQRRNCPKAAADLALHP